MINIIHFYGSVPTNILHHLCQETKTINELLYELRKHKIPYRLKYWKHYAEDTMMVNVSVGGRTISSGKIWR